MSGSHPTVTVPPTVEDAAAWAARMAARRAHATWRPSNGARRYGIALRRFAGPATYRSQVSHLRIAHLTDLHVGRITPFEVQRTAVEMTNAEHPDLVLLSGDFVCHSQLYLDQLAEVIRLFQAPVIAVLGNHDYWSGADEVQHGASAGRGRGAAQPQHHHHPAFRAPAGGRPRRRVHRPRAARRRRQRAAQGPAGDRAVPHRRGGGRSVAARHPARPVGAHARRAGDAGAASRAGGRQ